MTSRRNRSQSNASAGNMHPQRMQSPVVSTQQSKRQHGVTPAVYENNMRVLLRREPSILSIFDQFSHVCVYHHNGQKWEKQGYEGSMFLFEKQTYPPYGFFILNRMGTDDYIRPIHPEDDMDVLGDYLMYRYYPKFTQARIAMGLPYPIPPEHRPRLDAELMRQMTPEEVVSSTNLNPQKEWRGPSVTIGLWMFATDAREPLKDVMMRLHSYIKEGKPYPEEFRYGPGRPPPPNPHLRTASRASVSQDADERASQAGSRSVSRAQVNGVMKMNEPTQVGTSSELDKLFAKLIPPTIGPEPQGGPSKAGLSVADLFRTSGASVVPMQPQQIAPAVAPTPSRGLALLDSIFASATPQPVPGLQAPPIAPPGSLPSHPEEIQIVSPKPTSSALPQILNQDVISTLLGLGSDSRASSAAPSSASSHQSSQGYPEPSGVGSYTGLPTMGSSSSTLTVRSLAPGSGRVEGDVTPRAIVRGMESLSPATQLPTLASAPGQLQRAHIASTVQSTAEVRMNVTAVNGSAKVPTPNGASRQRTLVPFEPDSELWPYPRAPLDDRSLEQDDTDVVELDFADTRALSDPVIFSSRLKEKQEKSNGKKSRKERAAEREREREEIERGWDDPVRGQVRIGREQQPVSIATNGVRNGHVTAAPPNGAPKTVHTNGVTVNGSIGLHVAAAREAVVSALASHPAKPSPVMPRNDFVRELLTLIHMDKEFVDRLWQDYNQLTA